MRTDKKSDLSRALKIYWEASIEHKRAALQSLALPISQVMIGVAVPFFASKVIANLIYSEEATQYFYYMIFSAALGLGLNFIGIRGNMIMQARAMASLHRRAYSKLLSRSVGFFNDRVGGKLVSDTLDFANSYSVFVNSAFIKFTGFFLTIVSGLIVLSVNSLLLAGVVLLLLTTVGIWTYTESRRRSDLRAERMKSYRELAAHLSDTIVNAQTVKSFAAENYERRLDQKLNRKLMKIRERDWVRAVSSETLRVGMIISLQIILIGIIMVLAKNNPAAVASGIFAFTYSLTITNRFFELNTITRQVEESLLNGAAMTSILYEEEEIQDLPNAPKLEVNSASINIDNITFRYPDNDGLQNVFHELSLKIKPGEKIGLVGHSGSGKSTLTRLLLRFEDIDSGSINIDGQNISEVTQMSLREAIAYVPQEPLLFHRSISENISYGRPSASQDEIEDAAKRAFATEFIEDLPNGYETIVGERGVKLSGGQRQRIAIARAILKASPILLLDEATSALDSESETLIQKAFGELMQDKTTIVIAHRLSTVQKMDRIIVLNNGKIVEEGTHKELLRQKGAYAGLWQKQSGGFIEE